MTAQTFQYVSPNPKLANSALAPMLPITLIGRSSVSASGLLDSGASVNVLPFSVGIQLGLRWDNQTHPLKLSGNLSAVDARGVVLSTVVGSSSPVVLAFAWAQSDEVPIILGQVNFFMEFDICFFRNRSTFEVRPKT